ncbi:MAG: hypothetical protein HRU19_07215 [Pseudobacteriovorax sp.]|nr:hypothetical protein [Pseudobacteriovorax sp.]
MFKRILYSFTTICFISSAPIFASSKHCKNSLTLENELVETSVNAFKKDINPNGLAYLEKNIDSLRSGYKKFKCPLYQSYLGVIIGMKNAFVKDEKLLAKNFKESRGLLERSLSKTKRGNNELYYLISLKNIARSYSYLPKHLDVYRSKAKESLDKAKDIRTRLLSKNENKEVLALLGESLKRSNDRLSR